MAQLTIEKAKELLKKLQYAKAQMGQLSLNDEMYKQALEIALPILEQQERGDGEWIEWRGGECPTKETFVDVKFRDGFIDREQKAKGYRWSHMDVGYDIIAYRVVKS